MSAIHEFVKSEWEQNSNIAKEETIYFGEGIDNILLDALPKWKRTGQWMKTEDVLPFVRMNFEGMQLWAPKDPVCFLQHEYRGSYLDFPEDVGLASHEEFYE